MIEFEAKLIVGKKGVALIGLSEKVMPGWELDQETCNCVMMDIESIGLEDWLEFLPMRDLALPGAYIVRGEAKFSEDDADYSNVSVQFLESLCAM